MFTFRGRVRDTDGHSRSEGSEKTERIGVFELTGLGADAATISAKRHRIEQIVLIGLTVYSFEGTTKKAAVYQKYLLIYRSFCSSYN